MRSKWSIFAAVIAAFCLALTSAAAAHDDHHADDGAFDEGHQHGGEDGHLPASNENVTLIGKMQIHHPAEGRIADVGVFNGYAYLASFSAPFCRRGGVYVFDIRNPAHPKQVNFIRTTDDSFVGEGVQVIHIDTPAYSGDVLAMNNEICGANPRANGGLNLVDVTNPEEPRRLTKHAGDDEDGDGLVNQIHSAFLWDAGDHAYAVLVDDEESTDVDIMDITNPRRPVMVREYDVAAEFPQVLQEGVGLDSVFFHDVIVKEIQGRQVMLLSYWDAGYVTLDVTDPANATYIGDTDFTFPDPQGTEHGRTHAPEGNGHEAEFTLDDQYIVAADEDFTPASADGETDDGGTFEGGFGSGTPLLAEGEVLSGETVYVGRACPGDAAVPPASAEGQIAVVERGVCTFTEKVAAVEAAGGYTGIVIFNREGSDACLSFGMSVDGNLPTFSVEREIGFGLFDIEDQFDLDECLAGDGSELAPIELGTIGDVISVVASLNGWGYVHLYENEAGKMTELDTYAIPEAQDFDFASGFGDLSVHEAATSLVDSRLVYFAYYAGGFRVTRINETTGTLEEVGHFIDEGGNNFWGAQVFEHDGHEYIAASDRDFGLYIFEYTGP